MAKTKHPAGAYLNSVPRVKDASQYDKELGLAYTPMNQKVGTGGAVLATEDYSPITTETGADIGV